MGEPTFWMKIKNFWYAVKHTYLCWQNIHDWITWDDDIVCGWCGEELGDEK